MSDRLALNHAMLCIKTLDPGAGIQFSEYTGAWYVEGKIGINNGCIWSGITEHRDTPGEAVFAFFERLKAIDLEEYIAASPAGQRRHYRWNGAAFAEQYDSRLIAVDGRGRDV